MLKNGHSSPKKPARVVVLGAGGFIAGAIRKRLEADAISTLPLGRPGLDLLAPGAGEGLAAALQPDDVLAWYRVRDQFQSYMLHQGKKFVGRFDANTYLRIIDLWSRYDATEEGDAETPADLFARAQEAGQRWLVFSIDSDFCFYPEMDGCEPSAGGSPRRESGLRKYRSSRTWWLP